MKWAARIVLSSLPLRPTVKACILRSYDGLPILEVHACRYVAAVRQEGKPGQLCLLPCDLLLRLLERRL